MLRSMTGYGRAEKHENGWTVVVEIRSLNGKQLDANIKLPASLKPYEPEIRSLLQQHLQRGTIDLTINLQQYQSQNPLLLNIELARQYYQSLQQLAAALQLPAEWQQHVLSMLIKLPDVITPAIDILPEKDWLQVKHALMEAIQALNDHRQQEGLAMEQALRAYVQRILQYLQEIRKQDPMRREKIRQRLEDSLQEYFSREQIDQNRLEQELIYYIEKMDITEEQIRLENHCRYFEQILDEPDVVKGRKLSFLLQEMGREINTTGSKASDAQIQQWVVLMKDELEKAKEQVLNVL
ncbi:YicC/YloC family endoribonuclease [Thermoflavifilum thermophilum]|uniref:TIGR00255 family protein n=1 Tax=Thermoflavifilum thermophilum TaxID=1393122 RepID=A0A1I7ND90_9BACT|nr:YicC/YloC family endoribonuclease [Thermoflavifilum thermophilum]SFV32526.1 TIGR00255 family protein [Thermoflavifilum thermophilum]